MAHFHPLQVVDVEKNTRDSVVVTLKPQAEAAENFAFTQGQYLTFRRDFDGDELRRSYSICSGVDDELLQVGIKRVDGGAFSTWANEDLRVGDTIDAMPPMGRFYTDIDPNVGRSYAGFAAGSGITPILSIIKSVLSREPHSNFTLVYANRMTSSIMFREELEDLKNTYLGRLSVIHILKSESQDIDLFTGRIDAQKMDQLFNLWLDAETLDTAFICGPEQMMLTIVDSLKQHGLTDEQIKFELFASSQPGRAKKRVVAADAANKGKMIEASVTVDGTTRAFEMPRDGSFILDAALDNNIDAPYACKGGVCSTCKCKVLEGEMEMEINHALEDYEVRAGYVLSCQAIPISDKVVVSFDE